MPTGQELIEECKAHILRVMEQTDACQPGGEGLGPKALEVEAGLELGLPGQDNWFTWSLLKSMVNEGRIEQVEGRRGKVYRLP